MVVDYNQHAAKWHRDEPNHHSDFCGRPEALDLVNLLGKGKNILEIGCGEGYICRKIADFAEHIVGVDLSPEMIRLAIEQENIEKRGIEYHVSDVRNMPFLFDSTFDLCVGMYITNYFKPEELPELYGEMSRVVKENGKFVILMPHPILELTTDYGDAIVCDSKGFDYIKSRGKWFDVRLGTLNDEILDVGLYHTTLEDHLSAISSASLRVNSRLEPVFPQDVADKYPVFSKMGGKVGCLILVGEKI